MHATEALRDAAFDGELTIVDQRLEASYDWPPQLKQLLAGE